MREKQELLKREGERERDTSSLSIYARWGGVMRDDGNIKSGELTSYTEEESQACCSVCQSELTK